MLGIDKFLQNSVFDNIGSVVSYYLNELKPVAFVYLNELRDFQFRIANPLFWVSFLIVVFLLNSFWKLKKAVFFCVIIALVLLITTALENSMGDALSKFALFDYMVLRYISLFLILVISVYFFLIKLD